MKVLVTGGAGYIGTELSKRLCQSKEVQHVTIYDNLSKGHANFFIDEALPREKVKFVHGEILDSRLLRKTMADVDVVVHLAAKVTTPFSNSDPHFFEQVNHWGTAEVVYAAEESPIKKFIYLSSASVYGANNETADEHTIPTPRTFYGISKLRGEEHVQRLMGNKNAIVIRGGNVFGFSRSMRFDSVINKFMFDANFNNRIQIYGSGKQHRAFISIDHLSHCLLQTVLATVPNGTYNMVDKNLQILDIVDALKVLYPTLEFIFTNQHMPLRELHISQESKIFEYIEKFESINFIEELEKIKGHFSF